MKLVKGIAHIELKLYDNDGRTIVFDVDPESFKMSSMDIPAEFTGKAITCIAHKATPESKFMVDAICNRM
jgi:hypothetical protein